METKGAINYSQKRPTRRLRQKKTGYISIICWSPGQQLFTVLEKQPAFGLSMKNYIFSSFCTAQPFPGMTDHSRAGLNLDGKRLKCCFWEIALYNFTQKRRKLPRLPGTCWPRKLISILTKLDCTLIWMWSTVSRGILFCHRLKTPGQSNKAGSIGT